MFRIAIASGKGGAGKTTVSASLFLKFKEVFNSKTVVLADCDVEEPNSHLFLKGDRISESTINIYIPQIDTDKCSFCGKCKEVCEFNSIIVMSKFEVAEVYPDLCHSCGACTYFCPNNAITEYPKELGIVSEYEKNGSKYFEGRLKIGSVLQTKMIKETIKSLPYSDLQIIDAPPGTSCPVVEVLENSDFTIVVAEPTPFGLNDMKLLIETLKKLDKQFGVVINKSFGNFKDVYSYLEKNGIDLIAEIPFNKELHIKYSKGEIFEGKLFNNKHYSEIELYLNKKFLLW